MRINFRVNYFSRMNFFKNSRGFTFTSTFFWIFVWTNFRECQELTTKHPKRWKILIFLKYSEACCWLFFNIRPWICDCVFLFLKELRKKLKINVFSNIKNSASISDLTLLSIVGIVSTHRLYDFLRSIRYMECPIIKWIRN